MWQINILFKKKNNKSMHSKAKVRWALLLWIFLFPTYLTFYQVFSYYLQDNETVINWTKQIALKGYTTPKSRSCFCLHLRPKDDVVVSILVQGRSLLGSKIQRCLYVSVGETHLFGSREWFPLCQNRNNNKTQAYVCVHLDLSNLWLRGLGAYLNRQVEVRRLQVIQESR